MSFLANSLDRLMKERDWSQTELERRSGITQSQISRYLRGVSPEADALEKLCKPFGDDAGALVADWLKDLTPEALRSLVSLTARSGSELSPTPAPTHDLAELTPAARKVVNQVAIECSRVKGFTEALEQWLKLMGRIQA